MYKVLNGKWVNINHKDIPLNPIEEQQLVTKIKRVFNLDGIIDNKSKLTSDKVDILINFNEMSDAHAEICSRCLELNEKDSKLILNLITNLKND